MTSSDKPPWHCDGATRQHLQQQLEPDDSNHKCERWDQQQLLLLAPTATPGCPPSSGSIVHGPVHQFPAQDSWAQGMRRIQAQIQQQESCSPWGANCSCSERKWSNGIWNKEGLLGCSTIQRGLSGTPDWFCWRIPHYIHM